MVLIDALYINKGGGAVLLDYLIKYIYNNKNPNNYFFLLDARYSPKSSMSSNVKYTVASIKSRRKFYKENKNRFTCILCFANIPPPIKLDVRVFTYFQNYLLLESVEKKFHKDYFFYYLKYLYIKFYSGNTNYFIVQTNLISQQLHKLGLKEESKCLLVPFYDSDRFPVKGFNEIVSDHFAYISTAPAHKNHLRLFQSWNLLLSSGFTPTLHVTVEPSYTYLIKIIEDINHRGGKIINHGFANPVEIYAQAKYAIYPSLHETFGLGLVEAAESGLKIIASDLPYVKSVIEPSLQFDPLNIISIADAVKLALTTELPNARIIIKNEISLLLNTLEEMRQ